jgi:hypothetical protein
MLGRDMRRLWDHPDSPPEFKKHIVRTTSHGDAICLVLHWQGGDHTEVTFEKERTGRHRYVTADDTIGLIRSLARIQPDSMIASILNLPPMSGRCSREAVQPSCCLAAGGCSPPRHQRRLQPPAPLFYALQPCPIDGGVRFNNPRLQDRSKCLTNNYGKLHEVHAVCSGRGRCRVPCAQARALLWQQCVLQ